jgi:EAL domain-containing protein (putative c-di-GMP-specific phosphodiesterase class I)/DNA-binding SARP family transcriptional activator/FixJ family two-component response regulator
MGAGDGGSGLDIRVLGPFEAVLAARTVHVGSAKQRAVLALLALEAGKVVTSDRLCDLVWDDDQPASASATLQSLISRLRATLAGASGGRVELGRDLIRTREPGWVLDVEPTAVDALRFQSLTARARRHRARGEAAAAAGYLTEAMALWRGAALLDVVDAGYLATQATQLNQARLNALEDLADAELATGHPAEALALLDAHVEANPLRERGWGLLMVALYRLGRQAAALRAFQQVRAILGEELGLEPSPELADIEQRILRHDHTLAGPSPRTDRGAGTWTPPDAASPSPANGPSPSPPPPLPGEAAVPGAPAELADYSVVVVEDHDFQRRTVVQLLRGLGVGKVTDAANGDDALRILEAGPAPDVLICDIDMPGMDGVELVARVSEGGLACSIVIASGLETNVLRAVEAIGESHGLHVLAALEKPLTARRLGEVLRRYTRLNQERGDHVGRGATSGEELRDALESDNLTVQFEPRIDLTAGAFSSAEARGRLRGPDGSLLSPSSFSPTLAREGLLLRFVERLIVESCVLLPEAGRAGLDVHGPIRVALNVSGLPLADASLANRLADIVRSEHQDPRRFVCEVDDVALARASAPALQVLTRLRVKGFGLSMSYSGAGPSWTHQLERVPLSELKLDRRLVSAASGDPKRFAMVESATASARDRGLPVVADGCDSRADFDTLVGLGCSEVQGRFVAEPMPAAEMVAWALAGYQPDAPGAGR